MQERKERIKELLKEIEELCNKAIDLKQDFGASDLELIAACCTIMFIEEQMEGYSKKYSKPNYPENVIPFRSDK